MRNILLSMIIVILPLNVFCQNEKEFVSQTLVKDGIYYPNDLTVVGEFMFLKDMLESTGEYGIKMYNLRSGAKIKEFIRPGRGPSEYLSFFIRRGPSSMTLEISDNKNKKNDIYSINCIISLSNNEDLTKCLNKSVPNYTTREAIIIEEDLILNSAPNAKGTIFLSKRDKIIDHITKVPEQIDRRYNSSYTGSLAMAGYLTCNFERNKFAYFGRYFDQNIFFVYNKGQLKEYRNNHFTHLPELDVINIGGNRIIEPSDKAKFGFLSPTSDSSNIYVLYSGQTFEDVPSVMSILKSRVKSV